MAFDRLVVDAGEVWWGHASATGQERLRGEHATCSWRPRRCLELGCGTWTFTEHVLAALGGEVWWVGGDVSAILERVPILREASGSLEVTAIRP